MPKVSIVCAWYNRVDHIRSTIDSLLAQDYSNFDITIVNDGSPNSKVREVLDTYDDPRLRVIHQQNTGFTAAIARAIDDCDGDYIAIQGAGDESLPERISSQVALMESDINIAACATFYYLVNPKSNEIIKTVGSHIIISEDHLRGSMPITHGTFLYRRSTYQKAGGYNLLMKYAQDWELLLRMSGLGTIAVVPTALYRRYVFEDGATYDPRKRLIQKHFGDIARSSRGFVSADDIRMMELDEFIYLPRNIPGTIRIIGGSFKRRTYGFMPTCAYMLSRQILNAIIGKFS